MEPNKVQSVSRVVLLLFITGLSGFTLGWLQPNPQLALEGAQAFAGIVEYPTDIPQSKYYSNLYTVLCQICAFFLSLGVSERSLSFFLSGLIGMVSFQALALCILAFSYSPFLAVAFPFFILYVDPGSWGLSYPILVISESTYVAMGLFFPLLVVGLLGIGYDKAGGLLLGLSPAIHPSTGSFLCLAFLICLFLDRGNFDRYKKTCKFMLLGFFITGLSIGYHLWRMQPGLKIFSNAYSDYMTAFIRYWEAHRSPFVVFLPELRLFMGLLFVGLLGLMVFQATLPRGPLFLLRILVASALSAGLLSTLCFLLPERVPSILLTLAPMRMFNLSTLGFSALLIGLLDFYKRYLVFELILTTLVVSLFFSPSLSILGMWITSLVFGASVGVSYLLSKTPTGLIQRIQDFLQGFAFMDRLKLVLGWLRSIILGLAIIVVVTRACFHWEEGKTKMKDYTNDPLFLEVSRGKGFLLTGSDLGLIQLRTRRPILLDGSLVDILPYAPEAGPEMNRILKEIYGVDLFHPSKDIPPFHGALARDTGKILWEERSPEQWSRIRRKFHVTNVLTYADWHLKLPVETSNGELTLYQIPPGEA